MTKLTTSLYVALLMSDEFDSMVVQCAVLSEKKATYAAVAPCFFAASHSVLVEVYVFGSFAFDLFRKLSISPDRSHFCMPAGRSAGCTATLVAVGPEAGANGEPPHATTMSATASPAIDLRSIGTV